MKKKVNPTYLLLVLLLIYVLPGIVQALYNIGYATGVNIANLF